MFAEHDGNVANSRNISSYAANNVFPSVQIALSPCVELGVVRNIIIAFGQELRRRTRSFTPAAISILGPVVSVENGIRLLHCHLDCRWKCELPHDAMNNWDVFALDVINNYLAHLCILVSVPQEE